MFLGMVKEGEMEEREERCGWHNLPLEVGDGILRFVVQCAPQRSIQNKGARLDLTLGEVVMNEARGEETQRSNDPGLLMEVVLCFVCHAWKERKPFWENKNTRTQIFAIARWFKEEEGILTAIAAKMGSISMLKWMKENNFRFGTRTSSLAARRGHLDVLKWLHEGGCDFDSKCSLRAAKGGHLDVLKWLQQQEGQLHIDCGLVAAKGGHLEMMKWLQEQGGKLGIECGFVAANRGHLEVLIWLREIWDEGQHYFERRNGYEHNGAAVAGRLDVLKWLRENKCKFRNYHRLWPTAAVGGQLDVLKWLKEIGSDPEPGNEMTLCSHAAREGHVEVLKWAVEVGFPWDLTTCLWAAEGGQLEVLKWAHEKNKLWDDWQRVTDHAAGKGHLHILKWMKEIGGSKWQPDRPGLFMHGIMGGNVEVMKWLQELGFAMGEEEKAMPVVIAICTAVARSGRVEMLKWWREQGLHWDCSIAALAAQEVHLEMLEWALKNGCPFDSNIMESPPFVQRWLKRNGFADQIQ